METITLKFIETKPPKSFIQLIHKLIASASHSPLILSMRQAYNADRPNFTDENSQDPSIYSAPSVVNPANVVSNKRVSGTTPEKADMIVIDLKKAVSNAAHLTKLLDEATQNGHSILFLNPENKNFNQILLKYDGTENSVGSIKTFCAHFPEKAKEAENASLISPHSFRRYQVVLERRFVKKIAPCFGGLGFIKLPLNSVKDFIEYAIKNHADLIILPITDMQQLGKYLLTKKFISTLKIHPVSFFIGFP